MADDIGELLKTIEVLEVENVPEPTSYTIEIFENADAFHRFPSDVALRPGQTRDAIYGAPVSVLSHMGTRVFLTTALVEQASPVFVLLAVGMEEGSVRTIYSAFRLYGESTDELHRLLNRPTLAFATLLARYGIDYTAGDRRVRFVPVVVIPPERMPSVRTPEAVTKAVYDVLQPPVDQGDFMFNGSIKITDDPAEGTRLVLPFLIGADAYVAGIRGYRRAP